MRRRNLWSGDNVNRLLNQSGDVERGETRNASGEATLCLACARRHEAVCEASGDTANANTETE